MATGSATPKAAVDVADPRPDRPAAVWPVLAWRERLDARRSAAAGSWLASASWLISGFLFGLAIAHVLHWSAPDTLLLSLVGAALSWLGRGVATVLVAMVLVLGVLGLVERLTMTAWSTEAWGMWWLLPVGFLLLVALVLVARRTVPAVAQRAVTAAVTLELAAGVGSLALSVGLVHRASAASASSILLSSEDNAAWLNTVGGLRNAHGLTADTSTAVGLFGAVANTYLAFVRELSGGVLPHSIANNRSADIVLAAHLLLVVTVPVLTALMARRTLRHARPGLTLLCWGGAALVVGTYTLLTPEHGFLTAGLAIVLVLVASSLRPAELPDIMGRAGLVRWSALTLAVYTAGASWIPLAPLAGLVLVLCWLAIALPALQRGPARRLGLAAALLVPTLLMALALVLQYRDVADPVGGGDGLFTSAGGTPAATTTMTVLVAALLAVSWFAHRGNSSSLALPLVLLGGYAAAALLIEGWRTQQPPHYGTTKLLFVTVGIAVALGLVDLFGSPLLAAARLDAAAFAVVAVVFACTVEQGPMFAVASSHWPKAMPPTIWVKSVNREIAAGGHRVLCLGLTPAQDLSQPSLDADLCDRWASSLQGLDDDPAGDWRNAQLGRATVAQVVTRIKQATDLPWTVVYIGTKAQLKDPKAWYAPIVAQPGLHFVSSGF